MRSVRVATGGAVALWPLPLWSHDAFGDLGPFYQSLLHPAVDPLQGLLVVGGAAFLAGQSLPAVRLAYSTFVLASIASIVAMSVLATDPIGPRVVAILALIVGLLSATRLQAGALTVAAVAVALGLAAGSAVDPVPDLRGGALAVVGGVVGLSLVMLLLWGVIDEAGRRISPVSGAVIGGWVTAASLMLAALPA